MKQRAPVPVAILDLRALAGFFRSTALAIEIQANTQLEWKRYRDSTALNIAYALLPWKEGPGTAEVTQDWRSIRENTGRRSAEMLSSFTDRLHNSGPAAAALYVEQMERLGAVARRGVQELFADARDINARVAGQAGDAARSLAIVQFGCSVLLAATGCYVALGGAVPAVMMGSMTQAQLAGAAGATTLGYSITGALVKDAVSWKSAKAVAIEVGKDKGGAAAVAWFHSVATDAARRIGDDKTLLATAERKIAEYSAKLGRRLGEARRARYARGLARSTAEAGGASARIAQQGQRQVAGKIGAASIPIVFCALDIYSAATDLGEVWAATR